MMNLVKEYLIKVDNLRSDLIRLTQEMVRLQSVNPPGDERQVAEYIDNIINSYGLEAKIVGDNPDRVNVIGALPGYGDSKAFLFNGHIDTVAAGVLENWSIDPFGGIIKDCRIYGRGTGDDKGAVACAIIAARAMKEAGIKLKGDFLIHCVADEETGSNYGTKYLIEKGYTSKEKVSMAVCGEGSVHEDKIYAQLAVFGTFNSKIISRGKSAHISRPHTGINAVLKMSKVLLALDANKLNFVPHSMLPDPSWVAGAVIKGGVSEGVIPESCESSYSVRAVPGMTQEQILNEMKNVVENLKKSDLEINVEIVPGHWRPPSEMSTSDELFKIANKAVKEVVGYELKSYPFSGWNDTVLLRNAGIPTVVLGPADIPAYQGHGPDEWVSIDKLVDFAKIYGLMAMDVCGFFSNK
jgi:succinyl-diaminopimelate desuccinylase